MRRCWLRPLTATAYLVRDAPPSAPTGPYDDGITARQPTPADLGLPEVISDPQPMLRKSNRRSCRKMRRSEYNAMLARIWGIKLATTDDTVT